MKQNHLASRPFSSSVMLAICLAIAASICGTPPAQAVDVGFNGPYAPSSTLTYYIYSSNNSANQSGISGALNNLDSQTDMSIAAGSSTTAYLSFFAGSYTSGQQAQWSAWTTCLSQSGNVCWSSNIVRNTALSHNSLQALFCHELGHAVGLQHAGSGDNNSSYYYSDQTCMRGSPDVTKYADADVSRINQRY